MSEDSRPKTVFVTVGTTSFDELVKAATEESFQKVSVISNSMLVWRWEVLDDDVIS